LFEKRYKGYGSDGNIYINPQSTHTKTHKTRTSSTAARYSALGSRKMTGSGVRMEERRRPLASAGLRGITTCRR
jgi:hypothetical protein